MRVHVLVVAAGKGLRAGGDLPKQYQDLAGQSVLRRTLTRFHQHPEVDAVTAVIADGAAELFTQCAAGLDKVTAAVPGGAERQVSVRLGLEAIARHAPDIVLIHDGARPLVSNATIAKVIAAAARDRAALAALPVADTLKRETEAQTTLETVPRAGLWRAQTPQGFDFATILDLHQRFAERDDMTDDASLCEAAGIPVTLVEDRADNIKITRPDDFVMAERLLETNMETRVGSGFDVHAFEEGSSVTLCGVDIPHTAKLKGHSDADVGMHALTDAIYGALADGDIGHHFPPSDNQWRGASSDVFLKHAMDRLAQRGGRLILADVTLMCEAPKVGPHRDAMRQQLAEIMGVSVDRVAVKATTTEKLGFTGRGEGIAARATATISLPAAS